MIMTELYKHLQDIGNKVFDFLKQYLDKLDKDKLANPDLTKKDSPINTLFEKIKEKFGKKDNEITTPEANAPKKEETTIERANPDKEPEIKNPGDKTPKALTPEELKKQITETMGKDFQINNLQPYDIKKIGEQLKDSGLKLSTQLSPESIAKVQSFGKDMLGKIENNSPTKNLDNDELRKMKDLGQR